MIYSKLINSVIKFAYNKHQGQVDKSNIPYICHPLHIAEKMPNEELTIIALCHDLLEDTNTTIIELEKLGLNQNEINAICVLTHMDKNIKYQDYIKNLSKNSFAVIVKIADLEHNLQIERLEYKLTEKDYKRQEKYLNALKYLKCINGEES